jgi:hypothetical protein
MNQRSKKWFAKAHSFHRLRESRSGIMEKLKHLKLGEDFESQAKVSRHGGKLKC